MNIDVESSYQLSVDINRCHEGLEIDGDDKKFIPSLFHSTVIEHHRSIVLLVEKKLFSSACVLLRPLFEAYVKGLWFSRCATDKDFKELRNDKFKKTFSVLVSEIDTKSPEGSKLATPKGHYWKTLNSFTHSGAALLGRKYNQNSITNSHNKDLINSLLDFSANYALLSGIEISILAENVEAMKASMALASSKHGL
ncbi:DUF6988 family protein [Endozoicomonas sp. GU-1]|uniref:DUF6988 family protein n=1 Tax=Endozoicomonas sp. GU-1 TaxID=3009078 RepID=UPI0022B51CE2|nr:DUF5677 domain-containing protein [Endozoicomonas sp. GU-1]WBA84486.1 DUF5677 domain-containing protein [Endozoicomonas sp. GU-1]